MNALEKILDYSKTYKYKYLTNIICNILHSLFSIISIVSISPVLSMLLKSSNEKIKINPFHSSFLFFKEYLQYYIEIFSYRYGKIHTLTIFCIIIIFLFFIRNIFRYLSEYLLIGIKTSIVRNIRNDFHKKMLSINYTFFLCRKNGDLMSRLSNDVNEIEISIIHSLANLVSSPIMIVLHIFALFFMSLQLTLFVFLLLPCIGIFIYFVGNSLRKDSVGAQNQLGKLFSVIEETINSSNLINIFGVKRKMQERFEKISEYQRLLSSRVNRKKELSSPVSEFLGSIIMILIIWYGGRLYLDKKEIGPDILFPFIGLFFQIINPAKNLVNSISNIQKGKAAAERVVEILNISCEKKRYKIINSFKKKICFHNVCFIKNKKILIDNINLSINKGEKIAIIGKSGSGKSIVTNLLTNFYKITSGKITIDGINIKYLKNYEKFLGIVSQDPILFNDSIFNNIALGMLNRKNLFHLVMKASKIANAHFFIKKLPKGYNTVIGNNGIKLSFGERQRINIARVIFKNPPILILDESIFLLDSEFKIEVKKLLKMIMKNKTVLIMTHNPNSYILKYVDYIFILESGRIVEQGKYENLILKKKGFYRKLKDCCL